MFRPLLALLCLISLRVPPAPAAAQAETIPDACVDALATDANRWDGVPMDVFYWDGSATNLGEIADVSPVSLCRANGPLEILPPSQLIGCVLVDVGVARVGNDIACGAYREVRLLDDDSLLWVARSSAASNEVTVLAWNGYGFDRAATDVACWDDPLTPVTDAIDCGR